MYVCYPLSLRRFEDQLLKCIIVISHETVRFWQIRFGPMFAAQLRKRRIRQRSFSLWCWHADEVFVRVNGVRNYLWRALDIKGAALEAFASEGQDRKAALACLRRAIRRYGGPKIIVTNRLASYGAALKSLGIKARQRWGRWPNNRAESSCQVSRRREGVMVRFHNIKTLQRFADVQPAFHNHFNLERHLVSRSIF